MNFLRFFLTILLFTTSCKTKQDELNLKGFVHSDFEQALWPNPSDIKVCWEPIDMRFLYNQKKQGYIATREDLLSYQENLRSLATREYSRADINLKGWGECTENSLGIRIRWYAGGARVQKVGYKVNGLKNGILFDPPDQDKNGELFDPIEVFYYAFLHEIGHALGLRHEHGRRDGVFYEKDTESYIVDEGFAVKLGEYDANSIMNYGLEDQLLAAERRGDPVPMPKLSNGDINTLKNLYFHPTAMLESVTQIRFSNEDISLTVKNVPYYYFYIATGTQNECSYRSNYTGPVKNTIPINVRLSKYSGKQVFVCVLGEKDNKVQIPEAYTSFFITVSDEKTPQFDERIDNNITSERINLLKFFDKEDDKKEIEYSLSMFENLECSENSYKISSGIEGIKKDLLNSLKGPGYYNLCLRYKGSHSITQYLFLLGFDYLSDIDYLDKGEDSSDAITEINIPFENWIFKPDGLFLGEYFDYSYQYKFSDSKEKCNINKNFSRIIKENEFSEFNIAKFGSKPFFLCLRFGKTDEFPIDSSRPFGFKNMYIDFSK